MRGEIPFPALSPWQQKVWKSTKRHFCVVSGRRKGKSTLLKLFAVKYAAPGGLVLWTSGDSQLAEDGWKELTGWLEKYSERYAPNGKGVITLDGGGEIRKVSAANVASGRGPTPALVIVDECQTVQEGFIKRALPSMIANGGRMLLAGTPPDSVLQMKQAMWLRDMLDDPGRFPDWLIETGPTTAEDIAFMMKQTNPEFKDATWEQVLVRATRELSTIRQTLGEETYAREFEAKWVIRSEGRVLNEFTSENIGDHFDFDPREGDVYWFMDRGEGAAYTVCLFAQVMQSKPGLRVIGERFTMSIVDEPDFVEQCIQYTEEMHWPMPKTAIYDVRAPRYKMALFERDIQAFGRNRSVNEGIALLNGAFRKKWVNFHSRCSHLEGEMRDWRLKSNGEPSDKNRDGADALRYGYEYLIDRFGKYWRSMAKAEDMQALQRTRLNTVFTFDWV